MNVLSHEPPAEAAEKPRKRTFGWLKSPFAIGVVAIVLTSLVGYAMFQKDMLLTTLVPGDEVKINFAQDYRLREYVTPVKIGGVKVGKVSDVERLDNGTALVTVKLDNGTAKKIGSEPGAAIRPTILLGGNYYLELIPGGAHDDQEYSEVIPPERTSVPVELDQIASVLQPDAITGARSASRQLDATLAGDGRSAIQDIARTAPAALAPGAEVLRGLSGTRADDLTKVVAGLDATSRTLTAQDGQLDSIVANLATTSRVFGARSQDTADLLADLPETLDTADAGLRRLDTTLAKLRETAGPAEPIVEELGPLVDRATPVLSRALPVVRDLRGVLSDTRPIVDDLVPASQTGTAALDDLKGPVLDRLNGPVLDTVMNPYLGAGTYAGTGDGETPFYEELGYMVSNIDRASKLTDANGANVGFQPGFGAGSVEGVPINIESLWKNLANLENPDGPGTGGN
ncbi:MlaD family protein [Pseudonocardia sp. ICBG1034]|uniref:MlaD family protein n=1 Tax=Pseudonocardia sp. ICBG1034 TaxID=2844381 RepID=UPI00272E1B82|nr:MlaD family protein [Pseudonocardia sp. ICBG1034]